MLFNSLEYIFAFLPVALIIYFILGNTQRGSLAKLWLVICSLSFYGWWNYRFLPVILLSVVVNYLLGIAIVRKVKQADQRMSKLILIIAISFNLLLLGYFKYTDFFISNINSLLFTEIKSLNIILPLGISFFTFTQIAYLVDAYRSETKEPSFINYALFVTFFPHLLAGPILHHKEMIPQFESRVAKKAISKNIALGVFLFSIGLFKKVILADIFAIWANAGFDIMNSLTFFEAWITSLSYTLQLYFDFSGYTDMAIGSALMFNIVFPINFFSPYKALNIQDFWRRWHITLGRFFRDYIYFPLGGSKQGNRKTYINLLITFLLVGLWHGAGWTFVFWGFLHGFALAVYRIWHNTIQKMPQLITNFRGKQTIINGVSWLLTFNFVNMAWVFFRAKDWADAIKITRAMFGLEGFQLPAIFQPYLYFLERVGVKFGVLFININHATPFEQTSSTIISIVSSIFNAINFKQYTGIISNWSDSIQGLSAAGSVKEIFVMLLIGLLVCLLLQNSNEQITKFKPNLSKLILTAILIVISIMNLTRVSEFLYFNF